MDAGRGFPKFPWMLMPLLIHSIIEEASLVMLPSFLVSQKKGTELNDYTRWTSMVEIDQHRHNGINEVDYHVSGGGENLVGDAADLRIFYFPVLTSPNNGKQFESSDSIAGTKTLAFSLTCYL